MSEASDLPEGVPKPALRALSGAGITRMRQLTKVGKRDLLALHGMGPKAVRILKEALHEKGMSFADE